MPNHSTERAGEILEFDLKSPLHGDDIVTIEDSQNSYVKKKAKKSDFDSASLEKTSTANFIASTESELNSAISSANNGDSIYISKDIFLNSKITIPSSLEDLLIFSRGSKLIRPKSNHGIEVSQDNKGLIIRGLVMGFYGGICTGSGNSITCSTQQRPWTTDEWSGYKISVGTTQSSWYASDWMDTGNITGNTANTITFDFTPQYYDSYMIWPTGNYNNIFLNSSSTNKIVNIIIEDNIFTGNYGASVKSNSVGGGSSVVSGIIIRNNNINECINTVSDFSIIKLNALNLIFSNNYGYFGYVNDYEADQILRNEGAYAGNWKVYDNFFRDMSGKNYHYVIANLSGGNRSGYLGRNIYDGYSPAVAFLNIKNEANWNRGVLCNNVNISVGLTPTWVTPTPLSTNWHQHDNY